jgi:hypothetical protein
MEILGHLLPDDESPKSLRNYRLRLAGVACYSALIVTFFILPALLGIPYSVPKLGTVAWGADVSYEVESKVGSIQEELKAMNDNMTDLMRQNNETRATLIDRDIMESQKNWCEANERHERATAWAARIRDLMGQYARLTGKQFELPTCDRV